MPVVREAHHGWLFPLRPEARIEPAFSPRKPRAQCANERGIRAPRDQFQR
jgi:hypothetical protein